MPAKSTADKILASVKGLEQHLQPDETPLLSIPAIWDNGEQKSSTACDVIVTDQRLLGYYLVKWPRERLFLDEITLSQIRSVDEREKTNSPVFRELLVSSPEKRVYIRAPRKKITELNETLRAALKQAGIKPQSEPATQDDEQQDEEAVSEPSFGRQKVERPLGNTPFGITLLLAGGLLLEVLGILLWLNTGSTSTGLPLMLAGVFAVIVAIWLRRRST